MEFISIGTDQITISGNPVSVEYVKLLDGTAGSTDAIPGDPTYGLRVDVRRVTGTLDVNIVGGSSSGTEYAEGDTSATATGLIIFGKKQSNILDTLNLTTDGSLIVSGISQSVQSGTWNIGTLSTITNVVHIDDNSSSITVDNAGTFAIQENGPALTSLQLLDDVVGTTGSSSTTKGYTILGTDGTNGRILKTDSSGELQIDVLTLPNVVLASQASPFTSPLNVSGSNLIVTGTIQAIQNGTWNIGSISTLPNIVLASQAPPFTSPINVSGSNLIVTGTVQAIQNGLWNLNTIATQIWPFSSPVNVSGSNLYVNIRDGLANDLTSTIVSASRALDVNVVQTVGGGPGGSIVQYTGGTNASNPTGLVLIGQSSSTLKVLQTDSNGYLITTGTIQAIQNGSWNIGTLSTITNVVHVDDNSSSLTVDNNGTFVVQENGAALTSLQLLDDSVGTIGSSITTKGYVVLGSDGTNARALKTDSSGELQVDVLTLPNVTLASQANPFTSPINVSGNNLVVTGTIQAMQNGTWNVGTLSTITNVVHVDDNSSSLTVDNGGTFVVQENGAALTSLQLLDDTVGTAGSSTPSKGYAILGTDGSNGRILKTDSNGELQVDILTLPNITLASQVVNVSGSNLIVTGTVQAIQNGTWNIGTVSSITDITDQAWPFTTTATISGVIKTYADESNLVQGTSSSTGTSDTEIIAAQGGSNRIYLTSFSIANSSSTTNTVVHIKDGSTIIWTTMAPANGGSNHTFTNPLKLTANTALNFACLSASTTVYFSANGYKGL